MVRRRNEQECDELSTANMLFPELDEIDVWIERRDESNSTTRNATLVIDLSSLGPNPDPPAAEKLANCECARFYWQKSCVDGWDFRSVLPKLSDSPLHQALTSDANLLDEFGLRVLLHERMQEEGCLEVFADEADIVEMDRIANALAMRFCELDSWIEENEDVRVEAFLSRWVEAVIDAFKRYVEVRCNVHFDLPLAGIGADLSHGGISGVDVLAATVGLEALAEHEEFGFLSALWEDRSEPAQKRSEKGHRVERIDEVTVGLDTTELRWPRDFATASENNQYIDLTRTTWGEVDDVLTGESELIADLLRENPGRVLVDLEDLVDEAAFRALGMPMDLGTCAATLALNAAGCPTISACAGHVAGYPYIAFWTRASAKPLLIDAATAAGVGLGNAHHGAAEVFTNPDDAMGLLRFAQELRRRGQDGSAKLSTEKRKPKPRTRAAVRKATRKRAKTARKGNRR
jgi:hypothetical protein